MSTIANLMVKMGIDDSDFNSGINNVNSKSKSLAGSMTKIFGGIAIGAGILSIAKDAYEGITLMENATAQLDAVLKSTNGAAGVTKDSILEMASAMQLTTKFAEEDTVAAANMLLTFTNIGEDVFPQATTTLLDMATAMGTDASSSAIQLGKALNNPTEGMSALTRVGVTFTDEQKNAITAMQEMGDMAGAQQIILQELQKEFGGSAEAAGTTFAGQLEITKNALGEVTEELGMQLMPYFSRFLSWVLEHMPEISKTIGIAADVIGGAFTIVASIIEMLGDAFSLGFETIKGIIDGASKAIEKLIDWVKSAVDWYKQLADAMGSKREEESSGFSLPSSGGLTGGLSKLAAGGIVTRPTKALIGEAGPEAVIPLDQKILAALTTKSKNEPINITIELDGSVLARKTYDNFQREGKSRGTSLVQRG